MKDKIKKLLLKLTVSIFRILNFTCPDGNHAIRKVTYDKEGFAHADCELCGKDVTLVGKTLGEVDKMSLRAVERLLPKDTALKDFEESATRRSIQSNKEKRRECKKCGGALHIHIPPTPMERADGKTLFQCAACGEREYLRKEN